MIGVTGEPKDRGAEARGHRAARVAGQRSSDGVWTNSQFAPRLEVAGETPGDVLRSGLREGTTVYERDA